MIGKLSNMSEAGFYENSDKILNAPKAFISASLFGLAGIAPMFSVVFWGDELFEGGEESTGEYISIIKINK